MKKLSMMLGLALSLAAPGQASGEPVLNDQQKVVWQGEIDYWTYVNARDRDKYLSLWHPDFTGWPCDTEHPAGLGGLAQFADRWFAEKKRLGQVTTPTVEAVVVDKDFAITYLSTKTVWTDSDGVKQIKPERFIHTWKATDHGWKIIGGMCAPLVHSQY